MRPTDHYYYRSRRFNHAALGGGDPSWILSSGGDGAELDIDFVNDRAWNRPSQVSIASLLTCTRASTGYYTKADGTLQSFSSNVLRYGTNGLLVEESRTNLLTRSQEFDHADWTKDPRVSITADAAAAPDGSTTADKLKVATTDNSFHQCYQVAKNLSNAPYCASVYVKAAELTWIILNLYDGADNRSWFNVSAGTVGTSDAGNTATIQALADGWYRCCVARTASVTANGGLSIELASADNSSTFSGTVGQGHYIWGAQLEAGSFATSYIPTTSSSATRAADVVKIDPFVASPAVPGTVYCHTNIIDPENAHRLWQLNKDDSSNNVDVYVFLNAFGSQAGDFGSPAAAAGLYKTALGFADGDQALSVNGGAATTETAVLATDQNRLQMGNTLGSTQFLGTYVRRLAYWNTRLSNSALQALTA